MTLVIPAINGSDMLLIVLLTVLLAIWVSPEAAERVAGYLGRRAKALRAARKAYKCGWVEDKPEVTHHAKL